MRDWIWIVPALFLALAPGVAWWRIRRQCAQLERLLP
jgi:hypothetical protein